MTEHDHAATLMGWARLRAKTCPELSLLFAIPNGGHRVRAVAARLKAEGVKAGVPDYLLPVARGDRHGLFVELKKDGGKPSPKQVRWIGALKEQGYRVEVAVGWKQARDVICEYLEIGYDGNGVE